MTTETDAVEGLRLSLVDMAGVSTMSGGTFTDIRRLCDLGRAEIAS